MSLVEKASKGIASKTSAILNLDKDQQEVLEYGALNLLHTSLSVILIAAFGLLFHSLLEILIISLTAALLRQYSGGVHATSPNRCASLSLFFFGLLSLFAKYSSALYTQNHVILFQAIVLLLVFVFLSKYAPADSPNKRIKNPETRRKLKKAAIRFVLFLFLFTLVLWGVYFRFNQPIAVKMIVCVHIGMLWQVLSITPVMKSFIQRLDSLLLKIRI